MFTVTKIERREHTTEVTNMAGHTYNTFVLTFVSGPSKDDGLRYTSSTVTMSDWDNFQCTVGLSLQSFQGRVANGEHTLLEASDLCYLTDQGGFMLHGEYDPTKESEAKANRALWADRKLAMLLRINGNRLEGAA